MVVFSDFMGEDDLELPDLVPGVRSTLPTPTPFDPPPSTHERMAAAMQTQLDAGAARLKEAAEKLAAREQQRAAELQNQQSRAALAARQIAEQRALQMRRLADLAASSRPRKTAEQVAQEAMATAPSSSRPGGGTRKAQRRALLACGKTPRPKGKPPAGALWDYEVGKWNLAGSFIDDPKERTRLNRSAHRRPPGVKRNRKPYVPHVTVTVNTNVSLEVQAEYVGPV